MLNLYGYTKIYHTPRTNSISRSCSTGIERKQILWGSWETWSHILEEEWESMKAVPEARKAMREQISCNFSASHCNDTHLTYCSDRMKFQVSVGFQQLPNQGNCCGFMYLPYIQRLSFTWFRIFFQYILNLRDTKYSNLRQTRHIKLIKHTNLIVFIFIHIKCLKVKKSML